MLIDFNTYNAEVTERDNGTYFVKLSFPDVGLYIHGIRVVPSKHYEGEYVIYKPQIQKIGGAWKTNYEYTNTSKLWQLLQELAMKSVEEHKALQLFDNIENTGMDTGSNKTLGNGGANSDNL